MMTFLVCLTVLAVIYFGWKPVAKWLRRRQQQSRRNTYIRGWLWATEQLESGVTPEAVYAKCDSAFDSSEFDRGARDAIYKHELNAVEPGAE